MPSVVSMSMWELDEHATPDDAGVELLKPCHTLANVRLEVVRVRQAAKGNLGRYQSHGFLVLHKYA
jgi:hypothetical protein